MVFDCMDLQVKMEPVEFVGKANGLPGERWEVLALAWGNGRGVGLLFS